jgi:hypothetical protein
MYFELVVVHTLFITAFKQTAMFYQSKEKLYLWRFANFFFNIDRVTELQNFCDEADVEYNKILQHGIMHFLSSVGF